VFWVLHGFPLEILFFNLRIFCNFNNNNNREKSLKKILVIIMLVFAFGCSDSTSPEESKLVGKWEKYVKEDDDLINQSLLVVEFKSDGRFILSIDFFAEPKILDEGNYTLDNDKITIISTDCKNIKGNYRFEFKDNGVEFYLIDDKCDDRDYMAGFFSDGSGPIVSPNPIMNDLIE
jgi:uncharacterized protein (TIGR03066 family)